MENIRPRGPGTPGGPLSEIRIKPGDHVAVVGMTGGGKTVIIDYLMSGLNRMIVIDPKREFRKPGFRRVMKLEPWWKEFRLIWSPPPFAGDADDKKLARLLMRAWTRKNLTIFADDFNTLVDFFPFTTKVLNHVIRTGRSRKVAVWTAMQRPAWVPRWYLSESRHKFIFTLVDEEDRKRVAQFVGRRAKEGLQWHDFLYHRVGLTSPVLLRYNPTKNQIEAVPDEAAPAASPVRQANAPTMGERIG